MRSPSPSPSTTPLPTVADAPSGPWTSIRWLSLGDVVPLGPENVTVHGWSGGYVALHQVNGDDESGVPIPLAVQAAVSRDGIHWSAPKSLDPRNLAGYVEVRRIVEGPSGLLAIAYPFGDTCGGPEPAVALWTSRDGSSWSRVPFPRDFRTGRAITISGGPAGFLAVGDRGDERQPAIWTSTDGRTWTSRPLPAIGSGTLVLDGGAAFAGGFVVAGAVLGEEGCGGAAHDHVATWLSRDGASWVRASLPGAATAENSSVGIRTLTSDVVLATQWQPDGTIRAWTSIDGRTWVASPEHSDQLAWALRSDGKHGAFILGPASGIGPVTSLTVRDDGSIVALDQTGDPPTADADSLGWDVAVGPTGILALRTDGGAAWLGVPS